MDNTIKILLVEDSAFDAETILRALRRENYQLETRRVFRRADYLTALEEDFDLILSDHKLPDFDSFDAFQLLQASGKDIPFIIISGAISEDRAAQTLKSGAADFISKNSLTRLGSSIREALANKQLREANRIADRKLIELQERLQVSLESSNVGTWDYSPQSGAITFCGRALTLQDWDLDTPMAYEHFLKLIHEDDQSRVHAEFRAAFSQSEKPRSFSTDYRVRQSDIKWMRIKGRVYFNSLQKVERASGILSDVTEQKLFEDQLKKEKHNSEIANRAKSLFLANMSHEIRTPLGIILGYAELLRESDHSAEQGQTFLDQILKSGRELTQLVDDILDLSKVEEGQLEVTRSQVHLGDLVREIAESFRLKLCSKGLELRIEWSGRLPLTVQTDPQRLRQILINVLGNAIKFTDQGTIELVIQATYIAKQVLVSFFIKDTGIGIPDASKLFQAFQQGDATTTRRFGGTGLGLALSKRLAGALGGDLTLVDSRAGEGSVFCLTIDGGVIEAQAPKADFKDLQVQDPLPNLDGLRALVADDSEDNRIVISRLLNLAGAQTESVQNGQEAIHAAMNERYDVILMDIQMPGMDGYAATRQLRRSGLKIPIVALTAHAMREERTRALDAGCDAHLTKPIDRKLLIRTIAHYTRRGRAADFVPI